MDADEVRKKLWALFVRWVYDPRANLDEFVRQVRESGMDLEGERERVMDRWFPTTARRAR